MMLDPRVLQMVVTLAEELHFGRTAAKLYMSQPALSGSLKSLEQNLGVRLFKRSSRYVELTEQGRVFVTEARSLMARADRLVSAVRESGSARPLRIGYPPSINMNWLCSLVASVRREMHAQAQVEFISADAAALAGLLTRGELHAAFFMGRPGSAELDVEPLFRESLRAVVPRNHPMANSKRLALHQLTEEPVVWLRRDLNQSLYPDFLQMCSDQGYRPNVRQEVSTFQECLHFVREDLAISFLPCYMESADDRAVAWIPLSRSDLHFEIVLAHLPGACHAGLRRLIQIAQHRARAA